MRVRAAMRQRADLGAALCMCHCHFPYHQNMLICGSSGTHNVLAHGGQFAVLPADVCYAGLQGCLLLISRRSSSLVPAAALGHSSHR